MMYKISLSSRLVHTWTELELNYVLVWMISLIYTWRYKIYMILVHDT